MHHTFLVGLIIGLPTGVAFYFVGWMAGFSEHGKVSWEFVEGLRDLFITLNVTPPDNPFEKWRPEDRKPQQVKL